MSSVERPRRAFTCSGILAFASCIAACSSPQAQLHTGPKHERLASECDSIDASVTGGAVLCERHGMSLEVVRIEVSPGRPEQKGISVERSRSSVPTRHPNFVAFVRWVGESN